MILPLFEPGPPEMNQISGVLVKSDRVWGYVEDDEDVQPMGSEVQ